MKIGSIGYNYVHDMKKESFKMVKPIGVGAPLFLIIKSPALFTVNDKEYHVKANSFIILRATTPCSYTADGDVYTDDWMYIENPSWNEDYVNSLEIPLDEPIYIGNTEELSQLIHVLCYEFYTTGEYSEPVQEKYIDILFLKLSRLLKQGRYISSGTLSEKNYRFTQLRSNIYTFPDSVPDVDEMAQQMGMSRSGFQHLYKRMFGKSVISDVITARIRKAKGLLSQTNLTVKEIAVSCGYQNEYSFMRQFRQREGKTPTEYRNNI